MYITRSFCPSLSNEKKTCLQRREQTPGVRREINQPQFTWLYRIIYKLIRSTTNNNNNKLSQKVDLEMPKKKEKKMEIEFNWRESGSTRHRFQKDKKKMFRLILNFFREKKKVHQVKMGGSV